METGWNGGRLGWKKPLPRASFLPSFIEWGAETAFPGRALVKHPGGTPVITRILTHGDADRLADWLDGHELPVIVSPGNPTLAAIVLSRVGGAIVLGTQDP